MSIETVCLFLSIFNAAILFFSFKYIENLNNRLLTASTEIGAYAKRMDDANTKIAKNLEYARLQLNELNSKIDVEG